MVNVRLSPQMDKIISLVSSECGISYEEAIVRIFAISKVLYEKTNGKSIKIMDEDTLFYLDNVR